ncbi:hypothetical protein PCASD_09551 [Puccinia coronata f. sp. avenae]|uniref:Rgp1-domain-containing protein n=1 Tax=Puccinia coronata f. sp. avenae TaxID=200324 RepID=A0A2N5V2F8_9BASI|nr:hypothetical protein PCASD_09551 [Puccinia coronata f. sp. avenae]
MSLFSVSVQPSQAVYFAGERFQCEIRFTQLSPARTTSSSRKHSHPPERHGLIGSPVPPAAAAAFPNFSFQVHEPSATSSPPPTCTFSPKSGLPTDQARIPASSEADATDHHDHPAAGFVYLAANRKTSTPAGPSSAFHPLFNPRRASLHTLGASAPPHQTSFTQADDPSSSSSSSASACSGSLLRWTYCQLEGSFEVNDKYFSLDRFSSLRHTHARGGGRLSQADAAGTTSTEAASSSSWIGWLFGSSTSPADRRHSTASTSSTPAPPNRLPVFQNPISLLDVDVRLEPGQSRTYSFAIDLPHQLPPSHKGKLIKFQYELVVGMNLLTGASLVAAAAHRERVSVPSISISADPFRKRFSTLHNDRLEEHQNLTFRVPVRVFNHVYLNETRPYYDLFKPVISTRDIAQTRRVIETDNNDPRPSVFSETSHKKTDRAPDGPRRHSHADGLAGLEAYGMELLKTARSCASSSSAAAAPPRPRPQIPSPAAPLTDPDAAWGDELENGCMTAVELVTRSAPKVSFDIIKDRRLVAQLQLVKSRYRLGDTIEGTLLMNGSAGEKEGGRVLRYGVSLETVESTKPQAALSGGGTDSHHSRAGNTIDKDDQDDGRPPGRTTSYRKVYAETEELVVDVSRARFALVIPADACPAFQTNLVDLSWTIKLRLLFIPEPTAAPAAALYVSPARSPRGQNSEQEYSLEAHTKHSAQALAPRYSHLVPHVPAEGTFRPVTQLGLQHVPVPSSPALHHAPPPSAPLVPNSNSAPRRAPPQRSFSLPLSPPAYQGFTPLDLAPLASGPHHHHHHRLHPEQQQQEEEEEEDHASPGYRHLSPLTDTVHFLHCFVPVSVLPGNTPFNPPIHSFYI